MSLDACASIVYGPVAWDPFAMWERQVSTLMRVDYCSCHMRPTSPLKTATAGPVMMTRLSLSLQGMWSWQGRTGNRNVSAGVNGHAASLLEEWPQVTEGNAPPVDVEGAARQVHHTMPVCQAFQHGSDDEGARAGAARERGPRAALPDAHA